MCIDFTSEIETTQTNEICYKVVTEWNGEFCSCYSPNHRDIQPQFETPGKEFHYKLGKTSKSSLKNSPGIYAFRNLSDAAIMAASVWPKPRILKAKINKGTKYRLGRTCWAYSFEPNCICVEKLTPIEICKPE